MNFFAIWMKVCLTYPLWGGGERCQSFLSTHQRCEEEGGCAIPLPPMKPPFMRGGEPVSPPQVGRTTKHMVRKTRCTKPIPNCGLESGSWHAHRNNAKGQKLDSMSAPPKNTSRHEITIIVKRRNKTTNAQQVTLACVSTAHEARTHNAQPHQVDPASLSSLGFGCTHVREEHALQSPGLMNSLCSTYLPRRTTMHGTIDDLHKGPSRQGSSSFGDHELHNETAGLRSRIGRGWFWGVLGVLGVLGVGVRVEGSGSKVKGLGLDETSFGRKCHWMKSFFDESVVIVFCFGWNGIDEWVFRMIFFCNLDVNAHPPKTIMVNCCLCEQE